MNRSSVLCGLLLSILGVLFVLIFAKQNHAKVTESLQALTANFNNNYQATTLPGADSDIQSSRSEFPLKYASYFGSQFYPYFAPSNLFSPVSFSYALGILARFAGPLRNTAIQFNSTLGAMMSKSDLDNIHSYLNDSTIQTNMRSLTYLSINSANFVVNSVTIDSLREFMTVTPENYTLREKVTTHINSVYSTLTDGSMTGMARNIRPEVSATLYDSLYFTAPWQFPFKDSDTSYLNFTLGNGKTKSTKALDRVMMNINYYSDAKVEMLEMPFQPSRFVFGVLLPQKAAPKPYQIKYDVDLNVLAVWISKMQSMTMRVMIPKLRLRRMLRSAGVLKKMGLKAIFDPKQADLTSIATSVNSDRGGNFYISDVIHETVLIISEAGANYNPRKKLPLHQAHTLSDKRVSLPVALGSKNSSTTSVGGVEKEAEAVTVKVFRADHGFFYYIRDKVYNTFVLIGDYE
jgi:serine protease inhibitor